MGACAINLENKPFFVSPFFSHVLQHRFNILSKSLGSPSLLERLSLEKYPLSVPGVYDSLLFKHTQVFCSYNFALSICVDDQTPSTVLVN